METGSGRVHVDEVLRAINEVVQGEIGLKVTVRPESELLKDLRLDSLSLMTLVVALEDRFLVALEEDDAAHVTTVSDLAGLVVRRVAEAA